MDLLPFILTETVTACVNAVPQQAEREPNRMIDPEIHDPDDG